jgi:N-acetyl-anhydromuramyl-L-alanine amidase AmpD
MSADDYARAVIAEGQRRKITPRGIEIALATCLVESNLTMYANAKVPESMSIPHDAVGSDGMSVGLFQQQVRKGATGQWWWADAATCMNPTASAGLFYGRLVTHDYNGPNSPGSYAQAVQGSAFPDRYDQRMADAVTLYNRLTIGVQPVTDPNRPDFNEYAMWSPSNQSRGGTKVDLFLLHTQEGDGNADSLAKFLDNGANQVSYHYTISQAPDNGVTVCDVVDTDAASWSVLSANNRSINLCFAGSHAGWTRDQWLAQSRAIDVAAYIAVQDCKKYGISLNVVAPPYATTPGISDHMYVTKVLGDGTHTDVGPGFPWDVFAAAVNKYANPTTPPEAPPVTVPPTVPTLSDRQLLQEVWDQLRGPGGAGWPQLGGRSLVDALAELLKDKA